jgi:hypothetical protein
MPLISHIEKIDQRRQESIDQIVRPLHNLLEGFREGRNSCSFECDSILLGALTKEMHTRNLLIPRPETSFAGLSFAEIAQNVRSIQSPRWRSYANKRVLHGCGLEALIHPIIDSLEDRVNGLVLEDLGCLS